MSSPPTQRRIFAAVICVSTAAVLPVFLFGGLAVQVREDLGFSESAQGWVVFGFFGISSLSSVPLGRLVERWGAAPSMRTGALISALALLGAAASPNLWALLAALAVGGMLNAALQPGSNALIVANVPPGRNGIAFGVKQSAIPAATLLAGLAVPTVALTIGWRWAFVIGAVLAAAASFVVPHGAAGNGPEAVSHDPNSPTRLSSDVEVRGQLAMPVVALAVLGVGAGLGAATANALGAFLTSTAVDAGIGAGAAGALLSACSLAGLLSRLHQGHRADSRDGNHFRTVTFLILGGAAGTVGLASGTSLGIVVGSFLAFGSGWAWPGVFHMAVAVANRAAPARATGVAQTGTYAGSGGGPLLFGYLVEHGSYQSAWTVFIGIALLAALAVTLGNRLAGPMS